MTTAQKTVAFTSAAINYLPKVRLLFASIRQHHPEFELVLVLADRLPADIVLQEATIDTIVTPQDLNIPDLQQWLFCHDIVELSTAIKPFVLQKLLSEESVSRAIYFDPDMILFSRIDDILETLESHNIALTPHQVEPETGLDAIRDNEIASLKHGVFNLGFIAVKNSTESRRFAKWWSERLYHFCIADIPNGLFTDQKWINFAPIFFEGVYILKSPRFNVATWNLTTRRLAGDFNAGFTVNGEPLGFYHFTGFDSGSHRKMAVKNAADSPAVFPLIVWYEQQIKRDADDPLAKLPWAYGCFDDGEKIPKTVRNLYRERLDLQLAFPDPFSTLLENNFKNWLRTTAGMTNLKRWAFKPAHIRRRSTLQRTLEAVSRYLFEAGYRREINRNVGNIYRYEGFFAMFRYIINKR